MTEATIARTVAEPDRKVLRALRSLHGRATVGDVVAATGLAQAPAEQSLRDLLTTHRGHLAVGEKGDLLYAFDPKLIRRDHVPAWTRFKEAAKRFLTAAFKVWIVAMLVLYFVLFVALMIAALVAQSRGDGDRRGGGRHGGHFHIPSWWIWYLFWTPDWRRGRRYYGHQWEPKREGRSAVPFYKKVFAFVFGPDRPDPTQEQRDREVLRLIRARNGVLTVAELVEHTGLSFPAAIDEMGRLVGAYDGDVRVSEGGELVYVFPALMVSAHGRVREREPDPAWRRLEKPRELTGNDRKSDVIIGALNGFNLVAAATAPWWIFPRLGIGGAAALVGLVWVPLVFSALFFAIPLARRAALRRDNRARRARNVRKVLLGFVYRKSLDAEPLTLASATRAVRTVLDDDTVREGAVDAELQRLIVELEADVAPADDGAVTFRFPAVRRQLEAAEHTRRQLQLEQKELGRIVYASDDTDEESGRRALADFDAELERRVPAPEVAGYIDDVELADADAPTHRRR
jgi:hypothetical protein